MIPTSVTWVASGKMMLICGLAMASAGGKCASNCNGLMTPTVTGGADMPEDADEPISSCVLVGVTRHQRESVLATAAKLAELFDVPLVCAHVNGSRYETAMHPDGTMESTTLDPDLVEDAQSAFDQAWRDQIQATVPRTTRIEFRDLAGETAQALTEEAEQLGAEVIVVGTRAGGIGVSVQEFFRGSVAVHLAHRQWRPVVVVPVSPTHPDHPLPWERSTVSDDHTGRS